MSYIEETQKQNKLKRRVRLSSLLRSLEMTIPEAAEFLGTSPAIIANMMCGRTKPEEKFIDRLEQAFVRVEAFALFPEASDAPDKRFAKAVRRRRIEAEICEKYL